MDAEHVTIDVPLVRRLVAAQFPGWAHLPVRAVEFGGWDNRTFRLGSDMSVRLPSAAPYAAQVEKEQRWLPVLASQLPIKIPTPLATGEPGADYPWRWSVYRWIDGDVASTANIADLDRFAGSLARFLVALEQIDPTGGPPPGEHNFHRGGSLSVYDAETRAAIAALHDSIDADACTAVWDAALSAAWQGEPVWLHGDVSTGNLLVEHGSLNAVIDFGTSGIGDPSCDLVIAWTLFRGTSRERFRETVTADGGSWARARGWALWKALIEVAGFAGTDSPGVSRPRKVIDEVLADHARLA